MTEASPAGHTSAGNPDERARLLERIAESDRKLVLQSEEDRIHIRKLGRQVTELVNTVAAQHAGLVQVAAEKQSQEASELDAIRSSRFYSLGLAAAGCLRRLRGLKRRLRRGQVNPLFDTVWYLSAYPDVRWMGVDPYAHYLAMGAREGRKPNAIFDSQWYVNQNPDVAAAGANPLVHYFQFGASEGRNPAPDFDAKSYLEKNPESRGMNPLLHRLKGMQAQAAVKKSWDGQGVLVVAEHCPARSHAGGLRMLDLYSQIRALAPGIQLDLFTRRRPEVDWAYEDLPGIFSNIYFAKGDDLSVAELKRQTNGNPRYRLVDFQFLGAGKDQSNYRKMASTLIFTPMELLSRGFSMEVDSGQHIRDAGLLARQREAEQQELMLCRAVDRVVTVSNPDAEFLRGKTGQANVTALETGVSMIEFGALAEEPIAVGACLPIVVFVAYFGSATNVAALEWYLREVHPIVKAAIPDYRIDIVGRGPLSKHVGAGDPSINVVGEVSSVGPFIQQAALGIAPALGGAGFRGKINQYSLLGVPTVASPIAAEGMAYHDGTDVFVAGTPSAFATACIKLLTDPELRRTMAAQARETCLKNYSWASKEEAIREIYGLSFEEARRPTVTAIVPSYNHAAFIAERIESVVAQDGADVRLIVIDDYSTDGSDAVIETLRTKHGFEYRRRPVNSGSPFTAWEIGSQDQASDYVWICESDDVAEPDFLANAVAQLEGNTAAALYYCNSQVIDENGTVVDTTASYFRDIWQDERWLKPFVADGPRELADYQVRGMTVPNMSSALMRRSAFKAAFSQDLTRFKLTGDWLFIGKVLTHGGVVFEPALRNRFRRHQQTARAKTDSGRSQAEFIITKFRLHRLAGKPVRTLAHTLRTDATRFLYEPASPWQIFRMLWRVSWTDTLKLSLALPYSLMFYPSYLGKFRRRAREASAASP